MNIDNYLKRGLAALAAAAVLATSAGCGIDRKVAELEETARLASMPDPAPVIRKHFQTPKDLQGKINKVLGLVEENFDTHDVGENVKFFIDDENQNKGYLVVPFMEIYSRKVVDHPNITNVKLVIWKEKSGKEIRRYLEIEKIPGSRPGAYFLDFDANGIRTQKTKHGSLASLVPEEAQRYELVPEFVIDPHTGKPAIDPKTGQRSVKYTKQRIDLIGKDKDVNDLKEKESLAIVNRNYSALLESLLQSESFYERGKQKEEGILKIGSLRN